MRAFQRTSLLLVLSAGLASAQSNNGNAASKFGLNVRDFGAVGDCKQDDTAAIQTAISQISGHTLYFPTGCYMITKPILIPLASGWKMIGESPDGTILRQETDNTPILVFTKELAHSWEVASLGFEWSKPQPSQNTNAVAILFAPDTGTRGGLFNFRIHDVTFRNGFRGVYLASAPHGSIPVWGFELADIIATKNVTGATINLGSSPAVGMPRCILRNIYSSQSSEEPQISLHHCTSGTLDDIEDNNGLNTSLDLTSDEAMSVRGVHIEVHRMVNPDRPIIAVENSEVSFDGVTANYSTHLSGRSYLFSNMAGGGTLSIQNVDFLGASDVGAESYLLRLAGPVTISRLDGINLHHASMCRPDDNVTREKIRGLQTSQSQ
jgi:hypothetical protein